MSLNGGNSSAWELRFEVENRWLGIGNGDVSARLFVSAAETPGHRLLRAVEAGRGCLVAAAVIAGSYSAIAIWAGMMPPDSPSMSSRMLVSSTRDCCEEVVWVVRRTVILG